MRDWKFERCDVANNSRHVCALNFTGNKCQKCLKMTESVLEVMFFMVYACLDPPVP